MSSSELFQPKFQSYVQRLGELAKQRPQDIGLTELQSLRDVRRSYTYLQMDLRCKAIASRLQTMGATGQRALLACDNDADYLLSFLACAYAGVIAVPLYAPTQRNHLERYAAVAADSQASFILTTQTVVERNKRLGMTREDFPNLQWLLVDTVTDEEACAWHKHAPEPDTLCYLQYTSGSTGSPRGVMVQHKHLMYQGQYMDHALGLTEKDRALSWLPLYHDMGLIVGALQPLYSGFPLWLTAPSAVVMHPDRWLRAISEWRITFSGAPNFVYDLCVDAIDLSTLQGVDLSCWHTAFNAAEPIRARTITRFQETFSSLGLSPNTMCPAYGLAEATLAVTIHRHNTPATVLTVCAKSLQAHEVSPPKEFSEIHLVSSGRYFENTTVRIVNPETLQALPCDQIGEIWVSGPGPAHGYWGQTERSNETFHAHILGESTDYLRTGDLGFLDKSGQLFVTGRLKDLIIIAGKNHYPQDIEETVEQCDPAIRTHAVAAVAIDHLHTESLLVMAEVNRRDVANFDAQSVAHVIRRRIAQRHELALQDIVFLQRGQLPMTTSGKIRRQEARQRLLSNQLQILHRITF